MPTMRSKFSFQQFEKVLQELAYKTAKEAVETLQCGRVRIIIDGDRLVDVETNEYHIKFYYSHASFEKKSRNWKDHFSFDVEEKLYLTSNHCTKISFWAPDDKKEERKKEILEFIDKLMAEAGVSIEPRFQLAQMTQ